MATPEQRREELLAVFEQARGCVRCPQLASTRTKVVFGAGDADADLMFVGEAPGVNEDRRGLPFVGQAGKLLDQLLGEIGLSRSQVFIANTLKCLSPGAMVQLGDGSWERIGRLVRSRYAGTVMSVDGAGRLVARRVIGWHATPVADRSVFRLSYASAKASGDRRVSVDLTGDHPVLTERGYARVDRLRSEDRIAIGQGLGPLTRDVVCGTLLGGGMIGAGSAAVTFSHAGGQLEYARFKASLLSALGTSESHQRVRAVAGGEAQCEAVHVRTRAHRALGRLRRDFYRERKVVPDWIADALNPRMLAFWFMDAGHMRVGPPRQPSAQIAAVGFSQADLTTLRAGLLRLGLPAQAIRGRLHFDVTTTLRLSELIAPFVPPGMRPKLHPEVEQRVPFDASWLRDGPAEVMFDDVEVVDVTHLDRRDQTFFCIDVEETHNFVTSGGVVHNCRPPGNRDPLPVEIENCQEYLMRQLELIEPRVVCTLGNFATKLLRGDPAGITRVHGADEVRVLGRRAVRLYPLYHPAAALYTPRMVEVLREDFRRIPELLALPVPPQPVFDDGAVMPIDVDAAAEPEIESPGEPQPPPPEQLGLF